MGLNIFFHPKLEMRLEPAGLEHAKHCLPLALLSDRLQPAMADAMEITNCHIITNACMYTYTGMYAVADVCIFVHCIDNLPSPSINFYKMLSNFNSRQISDAIHASLSSFLGDAFQGIWPKEKDCSAQDLSKIGRTSQPISACQRCSF